MSVQREWLGRGQLIFHGWRFWRPLRRRGVSWQRGQWSGMNIFAGRAKVSVGTPRSCFIKTSRSHGFLVRQMELLSANDSRNEYHGETSSVLMSGKSVP